MYLTSIQIEELVLKNQYKYTGNKGQSRCFSGHFENSTKLPALALPGGDIGELVVLYSAGITYGIDIDLLQSVKTLEEIVGKGKNDEYQHSIVGNAEECRYLHLLSENPEMYSLNKENVSTLFSTMEQSFLGKKGQSKYNEVYKESACVFVQGEVGVLPHYIFETFEQRIDARILIYHKTFVDQRRRNFSTNLYKNEAVKLYAGLSEEYLYEALSEIGDAHVIETVNKLDPNMPIYSATISPSGSVKIENYS